MADREMNQTQMAETIDELRARLDKDELTGLYNREKFCVEAKKLIQANRDKEYVIVKWDVDSFKVVNELFGARIGDKILFLLADVINRITDYGIGAREEKDHFVICVEKDFFFMKMPDIVDFLENGITFSDINYPIYMHIGIYEIEDRDIPVETMCNRAEMALQTIKESYVKRYAFYDEKIRQKMLEEKELAGQLNDALESGQFFINLQPVYSVATGLPVSAEALVRWRHPEKGIISPGKFIPLSEKNGFVMKLDRFVWEEVCKMLSDFRSRGIKTMPVSINVSRVNFYSIDLCDYLMGLLKKYDLDSSCLKLEVTESAYTENSQQMLSAMEVLQKNGFKIMMDDFGSGYSSLNMLKNVLVDVLKIDMNFIRNLEISERASSILAHVVRMAKSLNMEIVAEGVETEKQRDFLGHCGCDCIQGFYYSRPLDISDYEALLCSREVVEKIEHPLDARRTILVVDDIKISRDIIVCNLEDDYRILEAENGKEALDILKKNSQIIDLVIADIRMPVMDGFELLEKMKESPTLGTIPTVVVTSADQKEDEIAALERGALDVIKKPFDSYEIRQRIKNLIRLVDAEKIRYQFTLR